MLQIIGAGGPQCRYGTRAEFQVASLPGGPGVELTPLEDAARFVGLLRSWRQTRLHWDFAAELLLNAEETGKEETLRRQRRRWSSRYGLKGGM